VSVYNDWVADFGRAAPKNFVPVAQMFPDDPQASTQEVCRAAELGFKQVHFLVGTVTPAMYQPAWDRFWDAAEEAGVIVSYHAGGVSATGGFSAVTLGGAEGGRAPAFNMGVGNGGTMFFEPFVGLFAFGVLERHPRLKFVLG